MRNAGVGLVLVLGMALCSFGEIMLTTHTNFGKMRMGLSMRVRLGTDFAASLVPDMC